MIFKEWQGNSHFFWYFLLSVSLGLTQFCKLIFEEVAGNIAGKKKTLNRFSCLLQNKLFSFLALNCILYIILLFQICV